MENSNARDLIQDEICLKMLGPGYAKDLILCSEDAKDEIIPGNPKNLYSTGVLMPSKEENKDDNENQDDVLENVEENNGGEGEYLDDDEEDDKTKKRSGKVEDPEIEHSFDFMNSHMGLVTCVSNNTTQVKVSIEYGTYEMVKWENIGDVKVKVGKYSKTIQSAIESFGEDEKLKESLNQNEIQVAFKDCFVLTDDGYLSISSNLSAPPTKPIIISNDLRNKYPVEASLVNLLFEKHYQRTHYTKDIILDLNCCAGKVKENDIQLFWNSFEARCKKFLKVLLKPIGENPIFQPQIAVEVKGEGCIESYVEPITSMEEDTENNINEFVYRKVLNYGKGVNCALDWSEDGQKVFTTFMPVADIEKFSSKTLSIEGNDNITAACQLRNLSIWSLGETKILDLLTKFVDGYASWCEQQKEKSANEYEQYKQEIKTILSRQKELKDRLNDNINYLKETPEAFECFKIANTAMLLQMVVARHPEFKKDKEVIDLNENLTLYNSLSFFENGDYNDEPSYYPFQLAFLLMNVKSTFEQDDKYHKDVVDLIWFPTGGGKTEAYLALTALTIVARRRRGMDNGVSVIMRYTLRMLTSQQFERASYLICALEMLRKYGNLNLGDTPISIGLYVGSGVTPNQVDRLRQYPYNSFGLNINNLTDEIRNYRRNNNPFPITYCPWCGCKLVSADGNDHGYYLKGNTFQLQCLNNNCHFNENEFPIYFIDEQIYNKKPTLLFATVDKFAQLAKSNQNSQLLRSDGIDSPDLIIQDELHLLTGALGSIVGFFETAVEMLCTKDGRTPKIIASTATTRNTHNLIKGLYGTNKEVSIFPPQGLEYDDNCFSHVEKEAKRRHIGIMPTGNTNSNKTEVRLTALLMLARVNLFKRYIEENKGDWTNIENVNKLINDNNKLTKLLDNYWTTVLYFNSIKDLGRSRSRVFQEVRETFRGLKKLYTIPQSLELLEHGFDSRVLEFTSRVDSMDIKGLLTKSEQQISLYERDGRLGVETGSDLIFASNMISVGIDISRWNIMLMVGQPRSTSEYVQSSSRVARSVEGLVINLLNPLRLREHSVFENYKSFHSTYYKLVEPLSVTPLTAATLKHNVLKNIYKIHQNVEAINPGDLTTEEYIEMLQDVFSQRFNINDELIENRIPLEVRRVVEDNNDTDIPLSESLRDITKDSYISIRSVI